MNQKSSNGRLARLCLNSWLILVTAHSLNQTPTPWPEQFHALLYMNVTSSDYLKLSDLWYDWPRGQNVNIFQKQLGELSYDVEWNNGTSYYYTLGEDNGGEEGHCQVVDFHDGIVDIINHVMTFEVGAVLPDSVTRAPAYCFNQNIDDDAAAAAAE